MVTVEVHFPALNRSYEFSLSETMPISVLIDEMAEMISQSERLPQAENKASFILCDATENKILKSSETLAQYGIKTAAKLILV